MKLRPALLFAAAWFLVGITSSVAQNTNGVATPPVFLPDYTHDNDPLPAGVLAWEATSKSVEATNDQELARFTFTFTNISGSKVYVLNVHPSCGCTTAELPPVPWLIQPGASGTIGFIVNLAGKSGTLYKPVSLATEKGKIDLLLRINIQPPPPPPPMSEAERAAGIAAAKIDRQAVFKGDCASCHLKKVEGKYGQQLYEALCIICHEDKNRATMVPDLGNLKVPTNEEFWRAWITAGKAGSLMPAFATSQGGPLSDLQIASLAAYLNAIHPSKMPAK